MKKYITDFIKAMILGYFLSAAALGVLAFLMYQFEVKETHLRLGILIIYVDSCLVGGMYIGRKMKKRQYLWGLMVGLFYFSVHMAGVIALEGVTPERIVPITALALLCMGSGMMGGAISCEMFINKQSLS